MINSTLLKTQLILLCIILLLLNSTALAQDSDTLHLGDKYYLRNNIVTIKDQLSNRLTRNPGEEKISKIVEQVPLIPNVTNKTLNDCGVKAGFTPFGDTSFSTRFNQVFTNTSTNATSFSWIINGFPYYGDPEQINISLEVGINEIKIVARNGDCTDTAVSYFFNSGRPLDSSDFYLGRYGLPLIEDHPTAFDAFKDGGYLIGGYSYKREHWNDKGMIMKVKESGCIEWTKSIEKRIGRVIEVKTTKDGGFLVSGYTEFYEYYFMRFDKNGNVMWEKGYDLGNEIGGIKKIIETSDGSFIVAATSRIFNGFIIAKVTPGGNMEWKKEYLFKEHDFASPQGIVEKGNHIYISGFLSFPNQENDYSEYNYDGFILKIESNTGSTLWTKNYGGNRRSDFFQDIHLFGNNLLVNSIGTSYMGAGNALQTFHIINENGEILKSTGLKNKHYAVGAPFGSQVIPISGDKLYLFNYASILLELPPYSTPVAYLMEIDTARNIYWQTSFFNNHRGKLLLATKGQDDAFAALGVGIGTLYSPEIETSNDFLLTRIERRAKFDDTHCYFGLANFSLEEDTISWQNFKWTKDELANPNSFNIKNEVNTFYGQTRFLCPDYIDSCNFLVLNGPNEVCNLSDTLTYRVHKNKTCFQPVEWEFPSDATVIQKNDSLLKIKLNSFGKFVISASLARSCTPIKDSLFLNAASILMNLNLGMDTSLCAGNSLKLKAGSSFIRYQWQDNSSDSTFIVKNEGTYWVRVQDSCGNISVDSIIVTIKNSITIKGIQDQVICRGDSVKLEAENGFINYFWTPDHRVSSTESRTPTVQPISDTTYFLKAEKSPGCFAFDTVKIKVNQPLSLNLGNDTSFCLGSSIVLDAGKRFQKYLWNDGSSTSSITASKSGTYHIQTWDTNGCKAADTLNIMEVFQPPVVKLNKDSILCLGEVITLDAGNGFKYYNWNTGSTLQKITVDKIGNYSVNVRDQNGCVGEDFMKITDIKSLPKNFLSADTVLCQYSSIQLSSLKTFNSYAWSTGSMLRYIDIDKPGIYWLKVEDSFGCIGIDSIKILPKECLSGVFIPNAFSPNNDGKNDIFKPMVFGNVSQYRFSIYNRWGEKIFETSDPQKGWDGKIRSISIQSSSYVWVCQYKLEGEETKVEKGTVNLIR